MLSIHSVTIDGAYGSVSGTQESLKYLCVYRTEPLHEGFNPHKHPHPRPESQTCCRK